MEPHVVVVGGGFGGLDAARGFAGAPVRVTLIDRHNYHLFQPLLYQVATAALSPGDIASPIRWILRHQKNVHVLLAEVRGIDVAARTITLDDDSVRSYDYLILAAGATHAYFGHPDWAARAPGLKTLDDALDMRREVLLAFEAAERETDPERQRRFLTFVIVGGDPRGWSCRRPGEIAHQSLRRIFATSTRAPPASCSSKAARTFWPRSRNPFNSRPRSPSIASASRSTRAPSSRRSTGKASCIRPPGATSGLPRRPCCGAWRRRITLARSLGVPLDRAGRVAVEPTLAVPGLPNVFVVGDLCALQQDGKWLPGVAQVAMQEGAHATKNILRAVGGDAPVPFRYHDYGLAAVIGRGPLSWTLGGSKPRASLPGCSGCFCTSSGSSDFAIAWRSWANGHGRT